MNRFDSFAEVEETPGAMDYDTFLSRLGVRDRQTIERHVAVCDEEPTPQHANLWKRMACFLAALASKPSGTAAERATQTSRQFGVQTAGARAVQFFAPDGKYRRQLFALEDLRDGAISVYTVDALAAALRAGALRGPITKLGGVPLYQVCGADAGQTVTIDSLTAANVGSAPDYYRHMVGWNRTALKVTLPVTASDAAVRAVNVLYALAARKATSGK